MSNLMQRADFLAFTRGPTPMAAGARAKAYGERRKINTHHGMGNYNQVRVMQDWFPSGTMFEFLGTICFSKGIEYDASRGYPIPRLKVLAPAQTGGLEVVFFSVKEALSIANQVSVDTINRLNGVNHRDC